VRAKIKSNEQAYIHNYNEVIRQKLIKLRENSGMGMAALAKACQPPLSLYYLSRLENGKARPRVDALERMLKVYGLTINEFLAQGQPEN
jgi:transcriptional regulator with XRE-family HTH domain